MFALSALGVVLCTLPAVYADMTIKAYVTHPDKLSLIATGANNEIGTSNRPGPTRPPAIATSEASRKSASLQLRIRRAMRDATAFHVVATSPRGNLIADYSRTVGLRIDRPVAENQTHTDSASPAFREFNRGFRDWVVLRELADRAQDGAVVGAFASTFRSPEVPQPVRVQCLYDRETFRLIGCFGSTVTIRYSNYAP